jgi:curli biogenesis system outer membrane secretion channel CsgG
MKKLLNKFSRNLKPFIVQLLASIVLACASNPSTAGTPNETPAPAAIESTRPSVPTLKRKVSLARFTNTSRYGTALLGTSDRDPLPDQAAELLTNRLVESGKFIVIEKDLPRPTDSSPTISVGVNAVILGSVTAFGRRVEGQSGFLNSKLRQIATATVEVRLVDPVTGQSFFSTQGVGTASLTVGEVAGFGSSASYDPTLNDNALSAAVSDLITNVMNKLEERRWSSDVLKITDDQVLLSGGPSQGLQLGTLLDVETRGEVVISGQSGLPITLPGTKVATIKLVSFFGDDPSSEGAIGQIVSGKMPLGAIKSFVVVETH